MEVFGGHARTRAVTRDTDSPANRTAWKDGDASRDVARVVSDVSVLCPRAGAWSDNAYPAAAVIIGGVAGLFPAVRVARVAPSEALRRDLSACGRTGTRETRFASSSPGRRGNIVATSSHVVSWLDERPDVDRAAHPRRDLSACGRTGTRETRFASSSPGRQGNIVATSSHVVRWLDERPDVDGAAHPDGRQSRGELDDGVGVFAFEQVEGAQSIAPLGGWPLVPDDFVSGKANGRWLQCCSNAVVRYHGHGGVGCSLNAIVQRAMGAVEAAFFLRGEVVQ